MIDLLLRFMERFRTNLRQIEEGGRFEIWFSIRNDESATPARVKAATDRVQTAAHVAELLGHGFFDDSYMDLLSEFRYVGPVSEAKEAFRALAPVLRNDGADGVYVWNAIDHEWKTVVHLAGPFNVAVERDNGDRTGPDPR